MAGDELTSAAADAGDVVVRQWLAVLTAELAGPTRWRAEVAAELRDGLEDAIARHRAEGCDAAGAAHAAVREFGDPRQVALGFAGEAGAMLARRVAVSLLASGPVAALLWLTALQEVPGGAGHWMPMVGPLIGVAAAAAVLAATAAAGRGLRWLVRWPALSPAAATVATGLCVCADLLMVTLFGGWLIATSAVAWPVAAAALTFSAARLLLAAQAVPRCAARAGQTWLATRGT